MKMFLQHWKTTLATVLCAVAYPQLGLAQVAPPAILEVDVENYVQYVEDTGDVTKYATLPNATPAAQGHGSTLAEAGAEPPVVATRDEPDQQKPRAALPGRRHGSALPQ